MAYDEALGLVVLIISTLFKKAGHKPKVRYVALEQAARSIAEEVPGKRLGLPMIGAGLAGGDWLIIKEILGRELGSLDLTVVVFDGPAMSKQTAEILGNPQ